MAITNLAYVKIFADLCTRVEVSGAPTTASVGVIGDVWLDNKTTSATYGSTWELTAITGVTPSFTYVWTLETMLTAKITAAIVKAEQDYLELRGIAFALDPLDGVTIVYPTGAEYTAAEMICYILSLGAYQGRGYAAISEGGLSRTADAKLLGYPRGIVGGITRYQSVV